MAVSIVTLDDQVGKARRGVNTFRVRQQCCAIGLVQYPHTRVRRRKAIFSQYVVNGNYLHGLTCLASSALDHVHRYLGVWGLDEGLCCWQRRKQCATRWNLRTWTDGDSSEINFEVNRG